MEDIFRVVVVDSSGQRLERVCAELERGHGLERAIKLIPEERVGAVIDRIGEGVCDAVLCSSSAVLGQNDSLADLAKGITDWGLDYSWTPCIWVGAPEDRRHPGFDDFHLWIRKTRQHLLGCSTPRQENALSPWRTALYGVLYLHLKWRAIAPLMEGFHACSPSRYELPPELLSKLSPEAPVLRCHAAVRMRQLLRL